MDREKLQRRLDTIAFFFSKEGTPLSPHDPLIIFFETLFLNWENVVIRQLNTFSESRQTSIESHLTTLFRYFLSPASMPQIGAREDKRVTRQAVESSIDTALAFLWDCLVVELTSTWFFGPDDLQKYTKNRSNAAAVRRLKRIKKLQRDGLEDDEIKEQLKIKNKTLVEDSKLFTRSPFKYPQIEFDRSRAENKDLVRELQTCQNPERAQRLLNSLNSNQVSLNYQKEQPDRFLLSLRKISNFSISRGQLPQLANKLKALGVPVGVIQHYNENMYYVIPIQFSDMCRHALHHLHETHPEFFTST